jgi:hypothetical protein
MSSRPLPIRDFPIYNAMPDRFKCELTGSKDSFLSYPKQASLVDLQYNACTGTRRWSAANGQTGGAQTAAGILESSNRQPAAD